MLLLFVVVGLLEDGSCDLFTEIKQHLADIRYEKHLRPGSNNHPVNVTTQLFIQSFGPVRENTFTYDVKFFHRQWWQDERLTLNKSSLESVTITIPPEDLLWLPDSAIVNDKESERVTNLHRTVISSKGEVYVSVARKATLTCEMNLACYPMDTQICSIIFESYGYHGQDMQLYWHKIPVLWDKERDLMLIGYDVNNITSERIKVKQQVGAQVEVYDNLVVRFHLKRAFLFYFYRAYIPTIIIMVFNWGSFWIPDNAIPERMTLIATTFLASAYIFQSVTNETVQVPYTTSMQLFLIVNICFIVGAILEYMVLLKLKSMKSKPAKRPLKCEANTIRNDNVVNGARDDLEDDSNSINQLEDMESSLHPLDKTCRILFPLVYIAFCLIYFVHYLIM